MNRRVSKTKIASTFIFSRVAKKAWKEFWHGRNGKIDVKKWVTLKLGNLNQTNFRSLGGAFGVRMGIYESVPWLV